MTIDLKRHFELLYDKRNSLLYWYPKIKNKVPTPKTDWVLVDDPFELLRDPEKIAKKLENKVMEIGGYPVFIRTDYFSGKHYWKRTCFVDSPAKLRSNLVELVDTSLALDLPINAIIVREFLELDWRFKAFTGELPIAIEVRVMIKDGRIDEWFFYWPEEAIKFPDRDNWKALLNDMKKIAEKEKEKFLSLAKRLAREFKGYWSADFARTRNGQWILIDMALGEVSWRPNLK